MLFASLSATPQTVYTRLEVFDPAKWIVWNLSTHLIDLGPVPTFQWSSMRRSSIASKVVLVVLATSIYRGGIGMTLPSARKVWLSVQCDDGKCSSLKWTRNHFLLHHHPAVSLVVETRLILLEDLPALLLVQGCPVSWWMFSEPDLLQTVSLFHVSVDFRCVHLFQILNVCDQNVSSPDSPRIQDRTAEYSRWNFLTELVKSWQVFGRYRVIFYHRTKWNYWSFEWFAESPFVRCLPIKQEILNVSKIAVALHGIRPPFLIQTWLQQYSRSSLFNPAYRSLSNPNCFWTMKRWRTMIPGKIFTCFPKFHRVVSVNGFWFPRRLQELLEALFCFQRSFCFARIWLNPLSCHILYHDWHIGDCLQIPSSRTVIWRYQVTKLFCTRYRCASAFSARSPCYLGLHADVAVSVLREVRKKLGLPDTTFPRGSET